MDPFSKEERIAKQQQEEFEKRKLDREQADALRRQKIQERQRLQSAMRKARQPGRDGKRKLGRESIVLLEKVKKLVAKGS
jgi:predicted Zn-dependent protease